MAFIKNKEDFVCEHCGAVVVGSGYTNHCPQCLWSKHVDVDPGDRKANCGGMMKPSKIEAEGDGYVITHRCAVCGHQKRNKISPTDNFNEVAAISKRLAEAA